MKSLPPGPWTMPAPARLRLAGWVFLVLSLTLVSPLAASARIAPVRVLVAASVAENAREDMSAALWAKLIADDVNAEVVPFDGTPTVEGCHAARAAYMVTAPFQLRGRFPGIVNSEGRVAALTHLVVTNCITGDVAYDRVIFLESDPPSDANAGDFEPSPEVSWSKAVPQQLAQYPLFFPLVARIKSVQPPFAYVDLGGTAPLRVGDMLRAFADASAEKRVPVLLTVTNPDGKYVQALFSTTNGDPVPQAGDYVEPVQPLERS
ncbi:MAG: hypothetical protein JO060_08075 [Candidatus Eremiobacteraeota bacterium]|nr:hypothetical protein [Candidatus Eremiobacteraeota bacterium]MBV9646999.1 hypothetical protein [Candidatus Eremiobacteraeota bacterium]